MTPLRKAKRERCTCCGHPRRIVMVRDGWRWCAECVEKLERARGLVAERAPPRGKD